MKGFIGMLYFQMTRETYSYWNLQYSYTLTHHFYDFFLKQHFNKYFKRHVHGYLLATMIIRAKYLKQLKCRSIGNQTNTLRYNCTMLSISLRPPRSRREVDSKGVNQRKLVTRFPAAVNICYGCLPWCPRWSSVSALADVTGLNRTVYLTAYPHTFFWGMSWHRKIAGVYCLSEKQIL